MKAGRWHFLVALLAFAGPLKAQEFPELNGAALAGVDQFDARFLIDTWLDVDLDQDLFGENGTREFVLALRRDGVGVEESASNYLFCRVSAASVSNSVVFVWDVEFYDFNFNTDDGLHPLLWRIGGITTGGSGNFTPERVAERCADAFASEWLRWNR